MFCFFGENYSVRIPTLPHSTHVFIKSSQTEGEGMRWTDSMMAILYLTAGSVQKTQPEKKTVLPLSDSKLKLLPPFK